MILEENFKWRLEAFASELFMYRLYVCVSLVCLFIYLLNVFFFLQNRPSTNRRGPVAIIGADMDQTVAM